MRIAELFEQASLRSIVVNMEHAAFDRGLAHKLAFALGGVCYNLPELRADTLLSTVKREIDSRRRKALPRSSARGPTS